MMLIIIKVEFILKLIYKQYSSLSAFNPVQTLQSDVLCIHWQRRAKVPCLRDGKSVKMTSPADVFKPVIIGLQFPNLPFVLPGSW